MVDDSSLTQSEYITAISWREQVTFDHYVVCLSIDGFWLHLWHRQPLLPFDDEVCFLLEPLLVRLLAHLIQMCYVNECVLFISWRLLFVSLTFQTLICTTAEPKLGKIVHGKKRLRFVQMKVILPVEGHKIRKITVTGWRVALFGQMVWLIVN